MRILAIRGENIASLEGAFEVDFREGPLGRAGLFAITGPTGAGKSTLLDALCLALFGTTPRLAGVAGRGHEVGRAADGARLTNRDPRALLRRGAGKGFAEVTFLGNDGRAFTARWSVRRARERADGRFQQVDHQLRDEDGTAIGRTQTEVLREIQLRLGLDYDQFCRSVLLAQGDFAAFLRADEKKRAELLEAVTGTGIYRELSIAAHERFAQARKELEALRREQEARPVLGAEERAALDGEVQERERVHAEARAAVERIDEARRFWAERGRRQAEVREAEAALQAADAALAEAAPIAKALAGVEEVEPLRAQLAAADEAAARVADARREKEAAEEAHRTAQERAAEAAASLEEARRLEREAASAREALVPERREAERLDGEIRTVAQLAAEARASLAERQGRVEAARASLQELHEENAGLAAELEAVERWLDGHVAWQPVAQQWERWERTLALASELAADRRRLEGERAAAQARLRDEGAAQASAIAALEAAASAAAAAEKALADEAARRPADGGAALAGARERIDLEAALAQRLLELAREAERLAGEARAVEERRRELAGESLAAEEAGARARAEGERLEHELAIARETLEDASAVLDLADRRALLEAGKPCPLCGSEAHPFAGEAPPAAAMVRKYRERVAALQNSLRACERRIAELGAQRAARGEEEARLAAEEARLDARLAELEAAWKQACEDARALPPQRAASADGDGVEPALPSLPPTPAAGAPVVATWREAIDGHRARLRAREAEARAAEAAWERARQQLEQARTRQEEAREARHRADASVQGAEGALRELRASLERIERDEGRLHAELVSAFGGVEDFEARLAADAKGFAAFAAETVEELRRRAERRQRLLHRQGELAGAIGPRTQALEEALRDEERGRAALRQRAAEEAERRRERAGLLGGASIESVDARLRDEADRCAAAVEAARTKAEAAGAAREAAAARVAAAAGRLEREAADAAERERALVEAAGARGLAVEEVRSRLGVDVEEVRGWRSRLEALAARRSQAATVLEERRRALAAIEEQERPSLQEEGLEERRAAAEASRAQAEAALHEVQARLLADDEARARSASYLPRIERAEAEHRKWERMHELIGSASGDKFQLFAQSLTLDALLENANAHLAELAPRYRLERAPGASLELQVIDRDLADEVRSTNSLSGGETFLVSLALALGLSALSSRATRVESLFIDEGFGTLDPQTLDAALATLDALQAAGRKVGLISHVPGMAERIGVQICVRPRGKGSSSVEVRVA